MRAHREAQPARTAPFPANRIVARAWIRIIWAFWHTNIL
jgi:hypothetical protein